ncbi:MULTISPECIES: hypothetical protein [Pseudomonas]|jgi:hypothetical protein|uniref:hypothetical protein n=1 Tax=Pseudomonas TaxID=286 RepID=UPI0018E82481|nr:MULTISPECIES: hypothetical protein [Pseudomonas]MBJ2213979.1 hypothetical protein [Pseudomonas carnis]MBP5947866.1 hypothetical protein [Pseudomonas sp. P9(2020)]
MIEWLTNFLFTDQCGPAAINVWGWVLMAFLFGGGGVIVGALLTSTSTFDDWN